MGWDWGQIEGKNNEMELGTKKKNQKKPTLFASSPAAYKTINNKGFMCGEENMGSYNKKCYIIVIYNVKHHIKYQIIYYIDWN